MHLYVLKCCTAIGETMKYYAIVLAAGQGKRMGAGMNKQFLHIAGAPLIVHTLRFFEGDERCQEVILVINNADRERMEQLVGTYRLKKVASFVEGGSERQFSVYNGLQYVADKIDDGIVVIHDGARPFLTKEIVDALYERALQTDAATTAVRVKDTIKRVRSGVVIDTLDRELLWAAHTPQAFRLSLIMTAHQKAEEAGFIGTDDASLVEWLGHEVAVVEGDYFNIKLTTPEDLLFAEAIMRERKKCDDDKNRTRV